jgi:hypothetical protein
VKVVEQAHKGFAFQTMLFAIKLYAYIASDVSAGCQTFLCPCTVWWSIGCCFWLTGMKNVLLSGPKVLDGLIPCFFKIDENGKGEH